jgi:hypothetical protein
MTFIWAEASGLPTKHAVLAAMRVAALIDPRGSPKVDARETYWHVASGGVLSPSDLAMGETFLIDLGLVVPVDGVLHRTQQLDDLLDGDENFAVAVLLALSTNLIPLPTLVELKQGFYERFAECIEDEQQQADALTVVVSKFDAAYRAMVGDIGEEHVLAEVKAELANAGHDRLARKVRRVSLISDGYGFDITAPRLCGDDHLLEVKSTTFINDGTVTIFISRHEADVGAQRENWMLVVCHVLDVDHRQAQTLGSLGFGSIQAQLPTDTPNGRWESAALTIGLQALSPGLPSPYL